MEERSVSAADLRFDDRPSAEHAARLDSPVLSTAVRVEETCNDRRRSVRDALNGSRRERRPGVRIYFAMTRPVDTETRF